MICSPATVISLCLPRAPPNNVQPSIITDRMNRTDGAQISFSKVCAYSAE